MKALFNTIMLLLVTHGLAMAQADSLKVQSDTLKVQPVKTNTSKKEWICRPPLDSAAAAQMADSLFTNNPVFKDHWNTEYLFVYGQVDYKALPDTIIIPLVCGDEEFVMTWYGHIFWGFGWRWGRMHRGLDLDLEIGDTVVAAFDGIIRYSAPTKQTGGYGNCVVMRHVNGLETLYGHLDSYCVVPGQFVKAGQMIGKGGTTGRSNGPHLHFETRYKDLAFNSFVYIDSTTHGLKIDTLLFRAKDWVDYRIAANSSDTVRNVTSSQGYQVSSSGAVWYTVRKGDCLYRIAKRYGTTVSKLMSLNHLKSDKLSIGQRLRIK